MMPDEHGLVIDLAEVARLLDGPPEALDARCAEWTRQKQAAWDAANPMPAAPTAT